MTPTVLYEVYDNRAVLEPIDGLVLLYWGQDRRRAEEEARDWGGCVVQVTCHLRSRRPYRRDVLTTRVVYIYRTKAAQKPSNRRLHRPDVPITLHQLRSRLKAYDGRLNPYRRKK